ncbi:MAG TPA: hypothetical protein VFX04_02535 [Rhodanobacteraceae bacterium]|nr:hypothetical protein [Rhodanobacteraceae bacterium]
MSSLWTDLLLLHGHIHDPELVRRLANTPSTPPPRRPGGKRQRMYSPLAALAPLHARPKKGAEVINLRRS